MPSSDSYLHKSPRVPLEMMAAVLNDDLCREALFTLDALDFCLREIIKVANAPNFPDGVDGEKISQLASKALLELRGEE